MRILLHLHIQLEGTVLRENRGLVAETIHPACMCVWLGRDETFAKNTTTGSWVVRGFTLTLIGVFSPVTFQYNFVDLKCLLPPYERGEATGSKIG